MSTAHGGHISLEEVQLVGQRQRRVAVKRLTDQEGQLMGVLARRWHTDRSLAHKQNRSIVTTMHYQSPDIQCESKKSPWGLVSICPKRLGIFEPNFTCLLRVPIYARLLIFIQLSATLIKLCHIKRDHPFHTTCSKCPPSAETHTGIFWHFPQTVSSV